MMMIPPCSLPAVFFIFAGDRQAIGNRHQAIRNLVESQPQFSNGAKRNSLETLKHFETHRNT